MGERRLKISDVSQDLKLNRGVIARLYNETAIRVDLEVVYKLCIYLDCDISDLFSIEKEPSNTDKETDS